MNMFIYLKHKTKTYPSHWNALFDIYGGQLPIKSKLIV